MDSVGSNDSRTETDVLWETEGAKAALVLAQSARIAKDNFMVYVVGWNWTYIFLRCVDEERKRNYESYAENWKKMTKKSSTKFWRILGVAL
jgi:hypothetical protein